MSFDIVPRSFFGPRAFNFWDDEDNWLSPVSSTSSGLSISEDENNVYIEAAVPGIDPKNIEVTFDKGVLWVKGQQEDEDSDKNKKYYRKASNMFSYHVAVPGKIDDKQEPEAVCKNGVMKVVFKKQPEVQPKKLTVKTE